MQIFAIGWEILFSDALLNNGVRTGLWEISEVKSCQIACVLQRSVAAACLLLLLKDQQHEQQHEMLHIREKVKDRAISGVY